MAESKVISVRQEVFGYSERARNERIARLGSGEGLRRGWGGSPYTQRAVNDMVNGIDLQNISLTPHRDIGVKYNRYNVKADGKDYQLEIIQPLMRTSRRYDVTLMGGDEVEYLNSIDLDKMKIGRAHV